MNKINKFSTFISQRINLKEKNKYKNVMNKKLFTVTVAVCALNEEANIGNLIKSILSQKINGFILDEILVISDGSTDKTVEIVKSFSFPIIRVKEYKDRLGKSTRLNEIYSCVKSDIVVQPDADVIFAHEFVLQEIITPFYKDENVGMTGGNPLPIKPKTFIEKSVNCTLDAYIPIKRTLKNGNNILSATGRLLAIRKNVFSKIIVPKETIANDAYVYFCNLTLGYQYRFSQKATVYFRSPQNLKDHMNQITRFAATKYWMKKYFPSDLVDKEYYISIKELRRNKLRVFLRNPIHSLFIFLINKYCEIKVFFIKEKINPLWDIVYSTKKLN